MQADPSDGASDSYRGQRASLLTQHGKERVIGPVLAEATGCKVIHTDGHDTDQLGTFTGEVPRAGSQLDAARRKARIGMALTGLELGLASEGAFAPDPHTGLVGWNYELILLVDDVRGIELQAIASSRAMASGVSAGDWNAVQRFAAQADFPAHHLVIRPDGPEHRELRKGIDSPLALRAAFAWALERSPSGKVFVEHDLRAHANPTRMANIRSAAMSLAAQMNSVCPGCGSPGFWVRELQRGLPCQACGAPTREPIARVRTCPRCNQRDAQPVGDARWADPARCDVCNP